MYLPVDTVIFHLPLIFLKFLLNLTGEEQFCYGEKK